MWYVSFELYKEEAQVNKREKSFWDFVEVPAIIIVVLVLALYELVEVRILKKESSFS